MTAQAPTGAQHDDPAPPPAPTRDDTAAVLFDLLYDRHLPVVGRLIWRHADPAKPLFTVGSSGLEYALVGGIIPVRNYRGTVTLEPTPSGGTTIRWSSTFKAKLPGTTGMIVNKLQPFIEDTARRLGDAAAR